MSKEINDIIIALKSQGFDEFARQAKLPIASVNALADAMLKTGARSAAALEKFRKTQESIGSLTQAQSVQLKQAIKLYDQYLRKLSEKPEIKAKLIDDVGTSIKQTKARILAKQQEIDSTKKLVAQQEELSAKSKKAPIEKKVSIKPVVEDVTVDKKQPKISKKIKPVVEPVEETKPIQQKIKRVVKEDKAPQAVKPEIQIVKRKVEPTPPVKPITQEVKKKVLPVPPVKPEVQEVKRKAVESPAPKKEIQIVERKAKDDKKVQPVEQPVKRKVVEDKPVKSAEQIVTRKVKDVSPPKPVDQIVVRKAQEPKAPKNIEQIVKRKAEEPKPLKDTVQKVKREVEEPKLKPLKQTIERKTEEPKPLPDLKQKVKRTTSDEKPIASQVTQKIVRKIKSEDPIKTATQPVVRKVASTPPVKPETQNIKRKVSEEPPVKKAIQPVERKVREDKNALSIKPVEQIVKRKTKDDKPIKPVEQVVTRKAKEAPLPKPTEQVVTRKAKEAPAPVETVQKVKRKADAVPKIQDASQKITRKVDKVPTVKDQKQTVTREIKEKVVEAAQKPVDNTQQALQNIAKINAAQQASSSAEAKKAEELFKLRSNIVREVTKTSNIKSPIPIQGDLFAGNKAALQGNELAKSRLEISSSIISKLTDELAKENAVNTSLVARERILTNIRQISQQTIAFLGDIGKGTNLDPKNIKAYQDQLARLSSEEKKFIETNQALVQSANSQQIGKIVNQAASGIIADIKNKNVQKIPDTSLSLPAHLQGPELIDARAKAITGLINKINEQIGKENLANKSLNEQQLIASKIEQTFNLINASLGNQKQLDLISPSTLSGLNNAKSELAKLERQVYSLTQASQQALNSKTLTDSFNKTSNEFVKILKNKQASPESIPAFSGSALEGLTSKFGGDKFDSQRVQLATKLLTVANQTFQAELAKTKTIQEQEALREKFVRISTNLTAFGTSNKPEAQLKVSPADLNNFQTQVDLTKERFKESRNLTQGLKDTQAAENELNKTDNQYQKNIGIAIGKIIRYRAAFYAMSAAIQGTKNAIQTFAEIQSKLAGLSKVSDPSASLVKFREEAFKMAAQFGTSVSDVVDSFKIWSQAGLKQNEVLKATQATLIGVNAIGLDSLQVTEALTAAIFTYNTSVDESVKVLSKWLAVERQFPVSAADLANSVKIVGAAGESLGVTLDDLAGFITAINASTRKSGVAIGQSIKTVFAEIPTKDSISILESVGIAVFKTADQFRDLDDIFDDLARQWNSLNSVTKTNIAITLAGTRRFSDFISLMDNYSIKLKATAISQRASNESLQAANIQLKTLDKSWQEAQAAVDAFSFAVGQAMEGGLATLVEGLKGFLKTFGEVGDVLPNVTGGIITFTVTLAALVTPVIALTTVVGLLKGKIKEYQVSLYDAAVANKTFQGTLEAFTAQKGLGFFSSAIGAFSKFAVWGSIIAGVLSLIGTAFFLMKKPVYESVVAMDDFSDINKKALSSLDDTLNSISTQIKLIDSIGPGLKQAIDEYNNFPDATNGAANALERINNIVATIPAGNDDLAESIQVMQGEITKLESAQIKASKASKDFSESEQDSKSSTDGLSNAAKIAEGQLQALKETLNKTTEATLKLRSAQQDLTESALKNKLRDLTDQQTVLRTIVKLDDFSLKSAVNLLKTSFEDKKVLIKTELDAGLDPERIQKNIQNTVDQAKEVTKQKLANLKPLDVLKPQDLVGSVDAEINIDSQFKFDKSFGLDAVEKNVLKNLDSIIDDVKSKSEVINNILGGITATPEQQAAIGINLEDAKGVQPRLEQIKKRIEAQFKAIKVKISAQDADIDVKKLSEKIQNEVDLINSSISSLDSILGSLDIQGNASEQLSVVTNQIKDVNKQLGELRRKSDQNIEFQFGVGIGKEALETKKKVDSLLEALQNTGEELLVTQQIAQFGDIVPNIKEKSFEAAQKFISGAGEEIRSISKDIGDFGSKIDNLNKFVEAAKQMEEAAQGAAVSNEDLKIVLSDIVSPEIFNELKESTKLSLDASNKLKEYKNTVEELNKQRLRLLDATELAQSLALVKSTNFLLLKSARLSDIITKAFEQSVNVLSIQQKLLEKIPDSEVDIQRLELKKIALLKKQNLLIAEQASTNEQRVSKSIDAQNQAWQDTKQVLEKIRDIQLDKIFSRIAENANLVQEALSGAFNNIPANILAGHAKRKELANEIHDIEIDIQDAMRSRDSNAVREAQNRLTLAKKEMQTYRKGWFEVRNIVVDIFDTVSQAFWKSLSSRFGELVSKLKLGETTVGDQVAKGMAVATVNLTDTFSSRIQAINDLFLSKYGNLLDKFLKEQSDLKESQTIGLSDLQGTSSSELSKWPTVALGNVVDRLKVAAAALSQSEQGAQKDFIGPLLGSQNLQDIRKEIDRLSQIIDSQNNKKSQEFGIGSEFSRTFAKILQNDSETTQAALSQSFDNSVSAAVAVGTAKTLKSSSSIAKAANANANNISDATNETSINIVDAIQVLEQIRDKKIPIPELDLSQMTDKEKDIIGILLNSQDASAEIQNNIADKIEITNDLLDKSLAILINTLKVDVKSIPKTQPLSQKTDFARRIKGLQVSTKDLKTDVPSLDELMKILDDNAQSTSDAIQNTSATVVDNRELIDSNKDLAIALQNNEKALSKTSLAIDLLKSSLSVAAASGATALFGAKNKGAQTGAGFGSAIGGALFTTSQGPVGELGPQLAGATGINKLIQGVLGKGLGGILAGPLGILAGGAIGGLFGGLFGGGDEEPVQKLPRALEDNTQAVNNNTLALKQLDKVIFNAPTGFNVPAFNGGAGFGRSVTINITGGDSSEVANKVRKMLNNDFQLEANSYGSRGYSR